MANSIIDLLLPSGRIQQGKNTHIFTPEHIAQDMIDLLPDEIWNENTTFLDICSKSGVFLRLIKKKLMNSQRLIELYPDKQEQAEAIEDNQLFGICPDEKIAYIVQSEIYGYVYPSGNIKYIKEYYKLVNNKNQQLLIDTIKENFKTMKFDVVIGNPPYNKGMDLDFVGLGYQLSKQYAIFITPAKWQTAEADQSVSSVYWSYGRIRKELTPLMSKVVFYPCCKDIFDIYQTDGITYFLIDKKHVGNCEITNICEDISVFNGKEFRSINKAESLLNIGNEIINFIDNGNYPKYKFDFITNSKKYQIWMNTKVSGFDWYATKNPRYVLSKSRLLDIQRGDTYSGEAKAIFESDSIDECYSYASWIYSKFTRFFLVPNISKLNNIQTNHCFRFVPAPPVRYDKQGNRLPDWDHIYTDQELYQAFNLPQKYIDVIEAVIKERK